MIHRMQATEDNNRPQNMPGRMSATEHEIGERKRLERERKKKNIRHSMFTHYVSALTHTTPIRHSHTLTSYTSNAKWGSDYEPRRKEKSICEKAQTWRKNGKYTLTFQINCIARYFGHTGCSSSGCDGCTDWRCGDSFWVVSYANAAMKSRTHTHTTNGKINEKFQNI